MRKRNWRKKRADKRVPHFSSSVIALDPVYAAT
jgi:hypothetical protein